MATPGATTTGTVWPFCLCPGAEPRCVGAWPGAGMLQGHEGLREAGWTAQGGTGRSTVTLAASHCHTY